MRGRRLHSIATMQMGILGTAPGVDSLPIVLEALPQEALQRFSIPLPIMALSLVEGTDHPFFTRGEEGKRHPAPQHKKWWAKKRRAAMTENGMPWIMFSEAASIDPIVVGKWTEAPLREIISRRGKKKLRALDAAQVKGWRPSDIPATTYSVSVQEILDEIRMHLLEDMSTAEWSLWTQEEVLGYLYFRCIRFLMETGIIRERVRITQPNGEAVVDLPNDLLELRRVGWEGVALPKADAFVLDHGEVGWQSGQAEPFAYVEEPRDPLTIRLVKAPSLVGEVDLVYVTSQEVFEFNSVTGSQMMPVPAAFCPALKYGTMADMLLKEGEAHDPIRAAYCEQRYMEGVQLAKLWMGATE